MQNFSSRLPKIKNCWTKRRNPNFRVKYINEREDFLLQFFRIPLLDICETARGLEWREEKVASGFYENASPPSSPFFDSPGLPYRVSRFPTMSGKPTRYCTPAYTPGHSLMCFALTFTPRRTSGCMIHSASVVTVSEVTAPLIFHS